jgi:hypothetical protein
MKNHGNILENYRITPDEAGNLLSILRQHDGSTLSPELDFQGRRKVSQPCLINCALTWGQ